MSENNIENPKNTISLFLSGIAIGVANVIPGVSGGTIAVVLGIYDRLIKSINEIISLMTDIKNLLPNIKNKKETILFLLLIATGAATGILAFSNLIKFLFENYNMPTSFFFIGLIAGSVPVIGKKALENKFNPLYLIAFIIAAAVIVAFALIPEASKEVGASESLNMAKYALLFISGFIAAGAMIIPGISGSFMLILLGTYSTIIGAVSDREIVVVGVVGVGAILGVLGFTKILNFLLKKFHSVTYFAILGLMLGSLVKVYPGFSFSLLGAISVLACAAGFILAMLLGKR